MKKTVEIQYNNIWTISSDISMEKKSLEFFDGNEYRYIKGSVKFILGDKSVPGIGYFGENDVDILEFVELLVKIRGALSERSNTVFEYQIPECGEPIWSFKRSGQEVFFSIKESKHTGANRNLDWQDVCFLVDDFLSECEGFFEKVHNDLKTYIPKYVDVLWQLYYYKWNELY